MDQIRSIPTAVKQNINYNAPSMFSGLPSLNVGGFDISLGPVGDTLGITATKNFAKGGEVPPRNVEIKGQPHMLAYITPQEGGILQLLGGSGKAGPMGIPSFYSGEDGPSGEADGGASSDPSGTSSSGASSGGDTGYSGSISDSMAASSPTGMTGIGGIGGYGPSVAGSTSMGLEDSIAGMAAAMGGYTRGLSGYNNVQGSVNYSPVQNVPYDLFGFVKGAMNRHARDSLSKGYSPEFSKDAMGNITSVTGKGGPGMSIPGIGGLVSAIGAKMGAVTTTGYAGKGVDDRSDPNDNGNDNELIRRIQPITPQEEYRKAITIYNQNPNRYTLRTR
jgi:hypothetical protein